MGRLEGWATFLVWVGFGIFAVFNATNIDKLAQSFVSNSVGLVRGVGTIGQAAG